MYEDNKGNFWIGTKNGLNLMDRTNGTFTHYTEKHGLPSNSIVGIYDDDKGNLWLSTLNGLCRFNPVNLSCRNYTIEDGLQSNEFVPYSHCKTKNGEMLFGGNYGFNIFNPNKIIDNPVIPSVIFTNFLIFNKPVGIGEKNSPLQKHIGHTTSITLTYNQSVITFEYAALSYTSPEKNCYAYKMEGFEKDWNYVGNKRSATYTNLSAGKYKLIVKASNNDGIWNQTGTSIQIIVLPPWWKTWWAYTIYFVFIAALLLLFRFYSLANYRIKTKLEFERLKAEKLHEVDQMKLNFFANISHEFRTPLTLISGPLDYFLERQTEKGYEKDQKYYSLMKRNIDRLLHLIDKVLEIRKLDSGYQKVYIKNDDIIQFLKSLADSFVFKAERKNINFSVKFNQPSFYAWFDSDVVDKIVFNLLSNAFKFTPDQGEINMETTIYQSGSELWKTEKAINNITLSGDLVKITITDNGIGIPAEQTQKIFDRFYQVENGHSHSGGSGIGLALVKELVDLLHGKIKLTSQVGAGSCFTIWLPIGIDLLSAGEHISVAKNSDDLHKTSASKHETPELQPETNVLDEKPLILIVEDNLDMEMYVSNILQTNYELISANNGKSGLELAREFIPDLIISDIMMPDMDGLEMCKILRNNQNTSHIPIILLTARSSEEHQVEGFLAGADDYIIKPFNAKILQLKVSNIIKSRMLIREKFSLINPSTQSIPTTNNVIDDKFLQKAKNVVEKHLDNADFSPQLFATEMGMSRVQLYRKLKAITNQTVSDFIFAVRINIAAHVLITENKSISEVAFDVGFKFPTHFSRIFSKYYGMSPSQYIELNKKK